MTARRALLDWLARDADIFEMLSRLAPLHPRNDTFPGEVFLHLAADALDWCEASRAEPLPLEELREPPQAKTLAAARELPALASAWPLPDPPSLHCAVLLPATHDVDGVAVLALAFVTATSVTSRQGRADLIDKERTYSG